MTMLEGVRVLELGTTITAPLAAMLLGDLGADVIKIERPEGDPFRSFRGGKYSPHFIAFNRNKRSVVLDLKSPDGKAAALALAAKADVLVSNVRPQGLARLGLDYESVRQTNASIIYCAAVGYGSAGPMAGRAVYDDLMQAASGISGLFQAVDGAPRYAPVNLCDRVVGLYVANAVTAALFHRERTGTGQAIEVPMFETMAQFVLADHVGGQAFVPPEGGMGYQRLLSRTRGPYQTQDGYLAIVVYTDKHWKAFCALVGVPDITASDAQFATQQSRTVHAEDAGAFLGGHLRGRGNAAWLEALHAIDIPACPVNTLDDLMHDPHLKAAGFFEEIEHPTEGTLMNCRFPVRFGATPADTRAWAPNLGEHTAAILGEG
jgi:crotonobetainyl-CoA:carnitine CoA-transferase CaiB-like acyl-CoA transferase